MKTTAPAASDANAQMAEEKAQLVAALQSELVGVRAALGAKVASLEETIANLAHENLLLKRRLFGNKTGKTRASRRGPEQEQHARIP